MNTPVIPEVTAKDTLAFLSGGDQSFPSERLSSESLVFHPVPNFVESFFFKMAHRSVASDAGKDRSIRRDAGMEPANVARLFFPHRFAHPVVQEGFIDVVADREGFQSFSQAG